ncbi:MAG: glycoside hydrolase family 88 protein, partial [Planctomycetota bacterium]|nr:glycoside hydrolase family 88 protein [Planctomycetota bacterium]
LTASGFAAQRNPAIDALGHHQLAAETAYSVAYPMLAMALHAGFDELHHSALKQLRVLRDHLSADDDLHLRYNLTHHEHTFSNWSRGVAWYAIGLVRTLKLLSPEQRPDDLLAEVDRVATWAARHQEADGTWPCFIKEHGILPDTSGTAGIAAAIALAVRHGMIAPHHRATAERAQAGLRPYLSSDGWLRGVAQSNKRETHDIDIQRMPYRVIGPWGMGMYAQLLAALN